jgi:hypothetical protein
MFNTTLDGTTLGEGLHEASRALDAKGLDAWQLTHRRVG